MITETSIIILIVINSIQLISHFFDKLNNSKCTGKNRSFEINMASKQTEKEIHHYVESNESLEE